MRNNWDDEDRNHVKEPDTPAGYVIFGIIGVFIGIVAIAMGSHSQSTFGPDSMSWIPTVMGLLIIGVTVYSTAHGIRKLREGNGAAGTETRNRDEKEELVNRVIGAIREENRPREKKQTVFCPYCGTALEEDYKVCSSCGAGRKGK